MHGRCTAVAHQLASIVAENEVPTQLVSVLPQAPLSGNSTSVEREPKRKRRSLQTPIDLTCALSTDATTPPHAVAACPFTHTTPLPPTEDYVTPTDAIGSPTEPPTPNLVPHRDVTVTENRESADDNGRAPPTTDSADFGPAMDVEHGEKCAEAQTPRIDEETLPTPLGAPIPISSRIADLPNGWDHLESIDLASEFKRRVFTVRRVPAAFRGPFARVQTQVIAHLRRVTLGDASIDRPESESAWALFLLLPRLLLHRTTRGGQAGARELRHRISLFDAGHWDQ